MSMEHGTPPRGPGDADDSMFTPNPIWERNRTRRGLGGRTRTDRARPDGPATAREPRPDVAPIGRPRTRPTSSPRNRAIVAAAIGLGLLAVGAVGAAGWYATQPRGEFAELTPGSREIPAAAAPTADPTAVAAEGVATPSTAPAATTTARAARTEALPDRRTTPTRVAGASRARPAATAARAASATDAAADASATATLPDGPQPYTALSGTSGAAVMPAEIPSTPPISSPSPAPTTPAAPSTTTPPPQQITPVEPIP